jgi:hypothetical protein
MDKQDERNWQHPDFKELRKEFPGDDIEWRIQTAGKKANGEIWGKGLAYLTSRAVMDRLDEVCGPECWQFDVVHTSGGFIGKIGIRVRDEWIWKSDGADETNIEAIKGGISGAFKRAAVHWGIGRYLYNLKEYYVEVSERGVKYQPADKKGKYPAFKWNPPKLPDWALPEEERDQKPPESHDIGQTDEPEGVKPLEQVLADIVECTNIPHLKNIYKKYADIFTGTEKTALIRATDKRKGELG